MISLSSVKVRDSELTERPKMNSNTTSTLDEVGCLCFEITFTFADGNLECKISDRPLLDSLCTPTALIAQRRFSETKDCEASTVVSSHSSL